MHKIKKVFEWIVERYVKRCPDCGGTGYAPDGGQCDTCAGTGEIGD